MKRDSPAVIAERPDKGQSCDCHRGLIQQDGRAIGAESAVGCAPLKALLDVGPQISAAIAVGRDQHDTVAGQVPPDD